MVQDSQSCITLWTFKTTAASDPLLEELHLDIAHDAGLRDTFGGTVPNNFDELPEAEQNEFLTVNNRGLGSLQGFRHLRKLS